ncbi:hypothetical protein MRX96_017721 [Rhipicephalus microplus]
MPPGTQLRNASRSALLRSNISVHIEQGPQDVFILLQWKRFGRDGVWMKIGSFESWISTSQKKHRGKRGQKSSLMFRNHEASACLWTKTGPAYGPRHSPFGPQWCHFRCVKAIARRGAPPGKYANLELMKVPNFLHLTPAHLAKHAKVLRPFCTPWPAGLETDEKCEEHFPVEVIDSDYCHAGPSIRDPRSRIVTLRVKLSDLELDYHARDKLLRLVRDRYDPATDVLTIVTDRCPLKKQNYDYAHYLLTAVYHESWKTEPWEADKAESDMDSHWPVRKKSPTPHIQHLPRDCTDDDVKGVAQVKDYAEAVCGIHNEGESLQSWDKYKRSVCSLLGLKHSELSSLAGEVHAS